MDPNQYNQPQNPYPDPYSPAPQPAQRVPNPAMYQPPAQPQMQPPQPQYGQQPQQPGYGMPQQPNPGIQPNVMPTGPIQQVQSPMMGYNPYPYPDEFVRHKRGPNKLLFGFIVVIIIVGSVFAVLAMNGKQNDNNNQGNQNPNNSNNNTQNSNKDVVTRSDGKLDLSSKINVNESLKAQDIKGEIDEQINLSSGFSFMVTDIAAYTASGSTTPATGKRFIVVNVVVGNRSESTNLSVSYLDFRLRSGEDTLNAGHLATAGILNNTLSSPSEIKPGEQITGKIVYEVATTESTWSLQHTETYQKTTDNTTFNVQGSIGLILIPPSTQTTTTTDTTNTTTTQ